MNLINLSPHTWLTFYQYNLVLKDKVVRLKRDLKAECATSKGMRNLFADKIVSIIIFVPFSLLFIHFFVEKFIHWPCNLLDNFCSSISLSNSFVSFTSQGMLQGLCQIRLWPSDHQKILSEIPRNGIWQLAWLKADHNSHCKLSQCSS